MGASTKCGKQHKGTLMWLVSTDHLSIVCEQVISHECHPNMDLMAIKVSAKGLMNAHTFTAMLQLHAAACKLDTSTTGFAMHIAREAQLVHS